MTIMEVVIVGFLMVTLGLGLLGLQRVLQESQLLGFTSYVNVDEANYNVSQMAREIRTMRQAQNGAYPLVSGNDNEITFYSDVDYDGESEQIRYYLEDRTLYKSTIEPVGFPATYPPASAQVKILTENVLVNPTPIFFFFNGDWPSDTTNNPLPTPVSIAEVRLVRISLTVSSNDNVNSQGYTLNTNVSIRMLKDNL